MKVDFPRRKAPEPVHVVHGQQGVNGAFAAHESDLLGVHAYVASTSRDPCSVYDSQRATAAPVFAATVSASERALVSLDDSI